MNRYARNILLFCLVGLCGFFLPATAISGNSVADEIISLDVEDLPLGEVLEIISSAANCQFVYDMNWDDYPVTAIFEEEPLYRGLKLVLRNINNAVIYGANRTIRIIIYDEATASDTARGHSDSIQSSPKTLRQPPTFGEAAAPPAGAKIIKASSRSEDDEQLPEAEDGTGSEESEAEAETGSEESETESDESGTGAETESDESETDAESGSEESETDMENADTPAEEAGEAETGETSAEIVPEETDSQPDTDSN